MKTGCAAADPAGNGHPHFRTVLMMAGCAVLILAGCFSDGNDSFPPLTKNQIVGCWTDLHDPVFACEEQCFDNSGAYYAKVVSDPDSASILEENGSYELLSTGIGTRHQSRTSQAPNSTDSSGEHLYHYARVGDALVVINPNDGSLSDIKLTRSDSINNCGEKWRLFVKPPNWSLP